MCDWSRVGPGRAHIGGSKTHHRGMPTPCSLPFPIRHVAKPAHLINTARTLVHCPCHSDGTSSNLRLLPRLQPSSSPPVSVSLRGSSRRRTFLSLNLPSYPARIKHVRRVLSCLCPCLTALFAVLLRYVATGHLARAQSLVSLFSLLSLSLLSLSSSLFFPISSAAAPTCQHVNKPVDTPPPNKLSGPYASKYAESTHHGTGLFAASPHRPASPLP